MRYSKIVQFSDSLLENLKSLADIIWNSKFNHSFSSDGQKLINKNIVIIGNGPSLQHCLEDNSQFLNGSSKMVLNFFPLTDKFSVLKPEYYSLVDYGAHYFKKHNSDFIKSNTSRLLYIFEKVDWPLTLFFSFTHKNSDFVSSISNLNNKNLVIKFFNTSYVGGFWFYKKFALLNGLGLPSTRNVSLVAIYIAILLKFKTINLVGFNHDWMNRLSVNEANDILVNDIHYSNNDTGNIIKWDTTMTKLSFGWFKIFSAHEDLNRLSECLNISIINRSKDSLIDAYKKG